MYALMFEDSGMLFTDEVVEVLSMGENSFSARTFDGREGTVRFDHACPLDVMGVVTKHTDEFKRGTKVIVLTNLDDVHDDDVLVEVCSTAGIRGEIRLSDLQDVASQVATGGDSSIAVTSFAQLEEHIMALKASGQLLSFDTETTNPDGFALMGSQTGRLYPAWEGVGRSRLVTR